MVADLLLLLCRVWVALGVLGANDAAALDQCGPAVSIGHLHVYILILI